jgi:hypothetical protein
MKPGRIKSADAAPRPQLQNSLKSFEAPLRARMKLPESGPLPKSKIRSQPAEAPVNAKAETKDTPVVPGDMSRGPKLMNSLDARSKAAAGRGAATKVGRELRGLVKEGEERGESGVSSAMDAGAGGRAAGVAPAPGGPGGLEGDEIAITVKGEASWERSVPGRTGHACARSTVLAWKTVHTVCARGTCRGGGGVGLKNVRGMRGW